MWYFANDIINDISNRIQLTNYSNFYIGITKDVESRLFRDHNVKKDSCQYLYYQAIDESNARYVESYFIDKWMRWWETNNAVCVYVYLITPYTRQ